MKSIISRAILITSGLVIAIVIVALVSTRSNAANNTILPGIDDLSYSYPTNENGETYGLDWHGDDYDNKAPDLIACIGENGREGYVKREDLDGPGGKISSIEEALSYEKERKKGGMKRSIHVYEEDGVTIIDEFIIL